MAAARYKMISIPEAVETVLAHTPALGTEHVTLADAVGRVLSAPVRARDALPPFPASIKDGYAVVAADSAGEFPVVGESRPGALPAAALEPGTVMYITTGAPVPRGADAVVQVEDTEQVDGGGGGGNGGGNGARRVRISKAAKPGQDIRPVGSDIEAGTEVLAAGEAVGVAEVGILATVGAADRLPVCRRPRVAVLSTGDEVVEPSTAELGPGQIRDANRSMLLAAAAAAGAAPLDLGIARDAEGDLEGAFAAALAAGADVVVTSGGVSMGDRDLIKPLLARDGAVHFGRVCMKPGKPLTFATLRAPPGGGDGGSSGADAGGRPVLVFGLPGNPVSSFVCFHLVVLPALRRMAGWAEPRLRRVRVLTTAPLKLDPERPEYHRATVAYGRPPPALAGHAAAAAGSSSTNNGGCVWYAVSTGNQISSRLLSARSANALLELPRAEGVLPPGTEVSALLIGDVRAMPFEAAVPLTEGF